VHAGYDLEAAALLLCEADGTPEEVEEGIAGMTEVLRRSGATAIRVSSSEAERQKFWAGRKAAFPAVGRIRPITTAWTAPSREGIGRDLKFIAAMEKKYDLRCPNVFHAGDGNLHPLILFDGERSRPARSHRALRGRSAGKMHRGRGHHHRRARRGRREDQPDVRAVRNRGDRALPGREARLRSRGLAQSREEHSTLHRCAEFGRMRVRGGKLPHPDLPRF